MLRRRFLAVVTSTALTTALLGATGCSSPAPPAKTPQEALAAAAATYAGAGSVSFKLETTGLPDGQNGVQAAKGSGIVSATEPKFQGTMQGTVDGVSANIEMIAIADQVWWKLFTPDFTVADLESLGAPNPATLFHPTTGLPILLNATTDLTAGEDTRDGRDIVHTYSGKLSGSAVKELLYLGDGQGVFDVTYAISEEDQLRKAVATGPFYVGSTSTFTLRFNDYGKPVTITQPTEGAAVAPSP